MSGIHKMLEGVANTSEIFWKYQRMVDDGKTRVPPVPTTIFVWHGTASTKNKKRQGCKWSKDTGRERGKMSTIHK